MKKLLLLSISAMMSLGAMAQVETPTLTKVWDTKATIPAGRFATAFGGAIYTQVHSDKKIVKITENEAVDYVANSLLAGVAIASDDKGNILVNGKGAGSHLALNNWVVVPANDKDNPYALTVENPAEGYNESGTDRIDVQGRIAGDITKDAVFYATPMANTIAVCVAVKDGVATATCSSVALTDDYKTTSYAAWSSTTTLAQPFGTYEEIIASEKPEDCCVIRDRSINKLFYFSDGESKLVKLPTVGTACAFDMVELNGVVYYILPTKNISGGAYGTGFVIFDIEGNVVAQEEESEVGDNMTTLIAEKVSETKANVYRYVTGKKASMYTFEVPATVVDDPTAIESVEVAAGAVEYYNLQGVKVANPENGLFIKKQGNKATKVVL